MMTYINYISALYRLKEVEKTVTMLRDSKYSDEGVPPTVLAQRDFIKKEVEYFKDESIKLSLIIVMIITFLITVLVVLFKMGKI